MSDEIEVEPTAEMNPQLVLITGHSGTGKSASLRNIRDKPDWAYLACEAGKRLPFRNKFNTTIITDPYMVHDAFDYYTTNPGEAKGIIIDSMSFLMEMFETQFVLGSADTMKGWSNYAQFFKVIMQQKVPLFKGPVIITSHVTEVLDEKAMEMRTAATIKGSLKNMGVEAFFSTVVSTKKMSLKELDKFDSDLLTITDLDKELGYKHVFQTGITKTTTGERIRSPMGMFTPQQRFMDNDVQKLVDHLNEYYEIT